MAENQPTRSTRLRGDLDGRFTEYRDNNGMSSSEALRSLVRTGLDYEDGDLVDPAENQYRQLRMLIAGGMFVTMLQALVMALLGIVLWFLGPAPLGGALMVAAAVAAVFVVLFGLGLLRGYFETALQALALARAEEAS
jgi:hypothetical protein